MALVNFLRFDSNRGAIISDEEYWNVHFRKRMHGDNLHPLLTPEQSEQTGVQAVYGSVGYPALHKETLVRTQRRIPEILNRAEADSTFRVKDLARAAFDALIAVIRLRIDQKMKFFFGFDTDDLNRGFYLENDSKISIKTEVVREAARKLADQSQKDTLLKAVLEAKAVVFGYDHDGITGYHLSAENAIMGYIHEGFEAVGSGKYASGIVLGASMKSRNMQMRQSGYEIGQGLFELIDSAIIAGDHFREVGGTYNMVILDRTRGVRMPYREVFDHQARLATEIVRACREGLLDRTIACNLLDRLIMREESSEPIEAELFRETTDPVRLHFVLRNYKLEETRIIANQVKESNKGQLFTGELR